MQIAILIILVLILICLSISLFLLIKFHDYLLYICSILTNENEKKNDISVIGFQDLDEEENEEDEEDE